MAAKMNIYGSKTLKLTNVLSLIVPSEAMERLQLLVEQQENFIKSHGAQPIGPMIQYSRPEVEEQGQFQFKFKLLRQSSTFLHHVDIPYTMESLLRVPNCIYVRFTGKDSDIHYAYEKIGVVAYEDDIKLTGDTYTIFLDQQDDILTADIFMPRADE